MVPLPPRPKVAPLVALTAVIGTACGAAVRIGPPPPPPPPQYDCSAGGTVVNAAAQPVPQAQVRASLPGGPHVVMSDGLGHFTVPAMRAQPVTVTIEASGFQPATVTLNCDAPATVVLQPGSPPVRIGPAPPPPVRIGPPPPPGPVRIGPPPPPVRIGAEPGGHLFHVPRGRVTTEHGVLARAPIELIVDGESRLVTTDHEGGFALDGIVPAEARELVIRAPGFAPVTVAIADGMSIALVAS